MKLPQYDKSRFDGQGDRVDDAQWEEVNGKGCEVIRLVFLEGWCVGFRPLSESEVSKRWEQAKVARDSVDQVYRGRLGHNKLGDILFINKALKAYDALNRSVTADDPCSVMLLKVLGH